MKFASRHFIGRLLFLTRRLHRWSLLLDLGLLLRWRINRRDRDLSRLNGFCRQKVLVPSIILNHDALRHLLQNGCRCVFSSDSDIDALLGWMLLWLR